MANIDLPLSSLGIVWDGLGYWRTLDVPVLFPRSRQDPVPRRGGNRLGAGLYASHRTKRAAVTAFNRNPRGSHLRPASASGILAPNPWPVLCKHQLCDCDQPVEILWGRGLRREDGMPGAPAAERETVGADGREERSRRQRRFGDRAHGRAAVMVRQEMPSRSIFCANCTGIYLAAELLRCPFQRPLR